MVQQRYRQVKPLGNKLHLVVKIREVALKKKNEEA